MSSPDRIHFNISKYSRHGEVPAHLNREIQTHADWEPGERVWWTKPLRAVLAANLHHVEGSVHCEAEASEYECRRLCPEHKKELNCGPNANAPGNTLTCPDGHRCRKWIIVNRLGETVGAEPPAFWESIKGN